MMQTEAERLVCAYSDLILRLSYTYLGSVQDAEDICQNVLIKLMTLSPEFSSLEHEKAWLMRLAARRLRPRSLIRSEGLLERPIPATA